MEVDFKLDLGILLLWASWLSLPGPLRLGHKSKHRPPFMLCTQHGYTVAFMKRFASFVYFTSDASA